MPPDAQASFRLPFPLDLTATLGPLQRGTGDPTIRFDGNHVWRAARTPIGPASVHLWLDGVSVSAESWGAGAGWVVEHAPNWLGFHDNPESFRPSHQLLYELHRRHTGLRMGGTGLVFESLFPTILEQKVPGVEAWASYARLVRSHGEPAPGPGDLLLQPSPRQLLALPYWAVHRLGIERRRFAVIQNAAAVAASLERTATLAPDEGRRRLMSLPGVGTWSAAEVSVAAYGDRDAVSVGDYHLPHQVAWALAGEARGTDARMLELLEPYRGHRARALRLLALAGIQAPRFGPRMRLRKIAAI